MPTATVEDYVKRLYLEQERIDPGALVQPGRLATAMGVVPGTVTTMVRTLADAGLVHYEIRAGVRLTEAGERLALHVLRRHRLVEQFLVKVLKYDWSEVHEEAEHLEHVISEKLLERIDELLGRPRFDPHGDPIPDADGQIESRPMRALSGCLAGERLRVECVTAQDAEFLTFARENGLSPGNRLTVVRSDRVAGTLEVRRRDGKTTTLSHSSADSVRVSDAG
jgi:DtxR family Mn-dependent transcriptional regulator